MFPPLFGLFIPKERVKGFFLRFQNFMLKNRYGGPKGHYLFRDMVAETLPLCGIGLNLEQHKERHICSERPLMELYGSWCKGRVVTGTQSSLGSNKLNVSATISRDPHNDSEL